jgi:two-component system sensor histidine kinase UhpB
MEPSENEIEFDSVGSGPPDAVALGIIEHQRTQEELRHSQDDLQLLFAFIPEYLWRADIDNQGHVTYRYFSSVVETITGRPPEFYMLGSERWLSTVHPDDRARIQKAFQPILTCQLPQLTEEYRIIRPDETVRWVRENVRMRQHQGKTRIDGIVSDITERKETEDALRLSEARLKEALLAAQMGVWEWRVADGKLTWDESLCRIAGRDPRMPVPDDQEQARMFSPEVWDRLKVLGARSLVTGTPFELDLEIIRPDGSKRWLVGRGNPWRDAQGQITHLRGTAQDITVGKHAEQALRQSEHQYTQLFSQMIMGFTLLEIVYDADGTACDYRHLEVNPAFERLTGIPRDRILGRRIREVLPDIESFWIETYGKVAATGESIHCENYAEPLKKWYQVTAFRTGAGQVGVSFADVTERKRAEEALRTSEAVLKEALLAAHMAAWEWTVGTDTAAWDENLYRIAGLDPTLPAPGYQEQQRLYTPESWERLTAAVEKALAKGTPYELDLEMVRPDGSKRWVIDRGEPRSDLSGRATHLFGTLQDITERKRAEDALRASEARYRFLFEKNVAAIICNTLDGGIIDGNEPAARVLGYESPGGMLGVQMQDIYWEPETRGDLMARLQAEKSLTGVEVKLRHKNGKPVWVIANLNLTKAEDSGDATVQGTLIDITERKRVEEDLRESEERYRQLFNLESDAILVVDVDSGRILDVNAAALAVYGYNREEFLCLSVGGVSTEPEKTRATVANGRTMAQLRWHRKKNGTVFPVEITGNHFVIRGRKIHVAAIRDITERKQAEEERQRSFDQLRALAAHLQSVREEERKRVAREIHDQLGQALTAIKIDLSSWVRELPASGKPIANKTSAILSLVDESIQTVRRIATELRPGILDDLGLVAAIEWAGEEFQARTGTSCRLHLPTDDIEVNSEQATATFRIFQEALTNVARHADATAVEVRLAGEGGKLLLEVNDNGKGISEDQLRASESLGILGMRERAMLLGGELSISRLPGAGTAVRVQIPGVNSAQGGRDDD